jgi:hypothetical protein
MLQYLRWNKDLYKRTHRCMYGALVGLLFAWSVMTIETSQKNQYFGRSKFVRAFSRAEPRVLQFDTILQEESFKPEISHFCLRTVTRTPYAIRDSWRTVQTTRSRVAFSEAAIVDLMWAKAIVNRKSHLVKRLDLLSSICASDDLNH